MPSSFLSMILSGKRDISEAKCFEIAERLRLSKNESKKLQMLLALHKSKHASQKESILSELKKIEPNSTQQYDLSLEHFKMMSSWFHLALPLMVELPGFKWSIPAAAHALGISKQSVLDALARLEKLEIIEQMPNGHYRRLHDRVYVHSKLHNESIKTLHKEMLEKSKTALDEETPESRLSGSLNFCLDEQQYKDAKAVINHAMEEIKNIADKKSESKNIYHLNYHFFSLLKKEP